MDFRSVYIPVGVPTYHLETAQDQFERSCAALRSVDPDVACPAEMLLTLDKLRAWLDGQDPDLIVFQNLTFANAAYMAEAGTDHYEEAGKARILEVFHTLRCRR